MMPFAGPTPPNIYLIMSLNRLSVMRRSAGDAPFPENISESRPAMVLIFKDYNLFYFERSKYIIFKNSKPHTWYEPICGYIFVKRAPPPLEPEISPENFMIIIPAHFASLTVVSTII